MAVTSCTGSIAPEQGWSAPAVLDGFVYVGIRSGRFLKVPAKDVSTSNPLNIDPQSNDNLIPAWQYPKGDTKKGAPTLAAIYGTAALGSSQVYITTNRIERGRTVGGTLASLNKEDGAQKWALETKGRIFGSPVLETSTTKSTLYVADDEGIVYAVDAASGRMLWEKKVAEKRFWSTPTVSGDTLYVGSMDKRLYAVDTANGSVKWTFTANGAVTSKPLVVGDTVYFGAFDRKFYAVNIKTHIQQWAAVGDGWYWNDPVYSSANRGILVGSLGGTFYSLDSADGHQLWTQNLESPVRATALVVNDLVYVIPRSGKVYILDVATGDRRRSGPTIDANVLASPAWADGYLYVHDVKERLHKVEAPAG